MCIVVVCVHSTQLVGTVYTDTLSAHLNEVKMETVCVCVCACARACVRACVCVCVCVCEILFCCSNNILLDGCLNAYVADLGFMMALPIDFGASCIVTSAGTIAMAGTRGYLAPEYGEGKVGPKCDVFSFGIVSTCMQCLRCAKTVKLTPMTGVSGDVYWSAPLLRGTRRGKLGVYNIMEWLVNIALTLCVCSFTTVKTN